MSQGDRFGMSSRRIRSSASCRIFMAVQYELDSAVLLFKCAARAESHHLLCGATIAVDARRVRRIFEFKVRGIMFRTLLSLLLAGLLVLSMSGAAALAQTSAQAVEQARLKVAKMGVGAKARVTVRTKDGRKLKGFISQAGSDDFVVRDRNSGEATTISYNDVTKVEDNRGHSTLRNVLIGVGIGAGALLTTLLIIFASLDD